MRPSPRRAAALAALATAEFGTAVAAADERGNVPLPEPLLTETVTDLDSNAVGELELEANGSIHRARRGGAYANNASLEAEWIMHPRFGVRIEPSFAWGREGTPLTPSREASVSAGAALKLVEDFERRFFLQAEVLGRMPWDESAIVQPGEPTLPFGVDLRAGIERGPITLHLGVGAGAFGPVAHVPLRGSIAVLTPFERSGRFGFWGLEVDADGARAAPFVAAANIVPNLVPIGVPLRVGIAFSWAIAERDDQPSLGVFLRVFYESTREIEFAKGQAPERR
jgi:hypothetical protein